jgi:hypothetical protein
MFNIHGDFECNRNGVEENKEFIALDKELTELRDFLNDLSYLAFGRDMTFIIGAGPVSGAIVLDSAIRTLESIRFCCLNANMADAYTLARKYRDDLFYYIYLYVIEDKQDFLKTDANHLNSDNQNVKRWLHNQQKDLHIGDILKCIATNITVKQAISKYGLKNSFDGLADRLNNYVHSNGYSYYNESYLRMQSRDINIKKQCNEFKEVCEFLTLTFLFILILVRPGTVMAYDYVDFLDCDSTPPKNSQYWVAPFVTDFINKHKNILDETCDNYLREKTMMEI